MTWTAILQLLHLMATVYMAAPLYMLLVVNERVRFGAPLGYYTDRYMENIIKHHAQRCFIVLATVLVTGVLLVLDRSSLSVAMRSWTLWVKFGASVALFGFLSYVHFYLQPRIEGLISQVKPDQPLPQGLAPQVGALRLRRKRTSALCLFTVLTAVAMGARMLTGYPVWLALVFVAAIAVFAYRTFKAPLPYGWF